MKKRQKYYVVWFGNPAGIFDSWKECKASIKEVKGAQYKSFLTLKEAKVAFGKEYKDYIGKKTKKKTLSAEALAKIGTPDLYSISVDAAPVGTQERWSIVEWILKLITRCFIKVLLIMEPITLESF